MAFNVTYSFNNGAVTGTVTSILQLRQAIYNYAHSGSVSSDSGSNYNYLTQCTLSGIAEGQLTTGDNKGTTTGTSYGLFNSCSSLTTVDLSNLDTSNVTSMNNMFAYCSALTTLDLSNLNTSSVTNMTWMFVSCSALTTLDLSSFNTSNVTNMSYMITDCSSLTSLDLSNFDTSNVTDMSSMFGGCLSLTTLDASNWNTSKVNDMGVMFNACSNLEHIYVSDTFITTQVTSSIGMFTSCTKLPNFNSGVIDKAKAYVGEGGYLESAPVYIIQQYINYNGARRKAYPKLQTNLWTGTQAEYDAITTKDSNTLYFIKAGD